MDFVLIFLGLSLVNVIFSTVRSLVTINGGKFSASIISGAYFAFYNIMLVWAVADFPMWQKCIITFVCNVVGVFIVKLIEEKKRKEKLWKVEATVRKEEFEENKELFEAMKVPHNYIDIGKWVVMNFYCSTGKQSEAVKMFLGDSNAKYFVSESKVL